MTVAVAEWLSPLTEKTSGIDMLSTPAEPITLKQIGSVIMEFELRSAICPQAGVRPGETRPTASGVGLSGLLWSRHDELFRVTNRDAMSVVNLVRSP